MKKISVLESQRIVAGASIKCGSCGKKFTVQGSGWKVIHRSKANHTIQNAP